MKKHLFSLIALFTCFANHSFAQCSLDVITEKLSKSTLNAAFVQDKKIAALSNPLKSIGNIWFSEDAELVWQVQKPIKSTMVIKQGKILQFNRKDKQLESNQMTAPSSLATLFYNIASGKLSDLKTQFELNLRCNGTSWEVTLSPKEQQISQFIKELKLIGVEQIDSFSYEENRGDKTHVSLTHLKEDLSPKFSRYLN